MRERLTQQQKQNEQIRKNCQLQRITMASQRRAMKLQREGGQTQELLRRLSHIHEPPAFLPEPY